MIPTKDDWSRFIAEIRRDVVGGLEGVRDDMTRHFAAVEMLDVQALKRPGG